LRRDKNFGAEIKTFAKRQKLWRRHKYLQRRDKNIGGDTMLIAERQKQSAKPRRPWSETITILLINKTIRRQAILPMVGETLPMVGDTTTFAKRQKHWRRDKDDGRRHDDVSREAKNIVEDAKMLAEKQKRWSTSRIRRSLLSNYWLNDSTHGLCHIIIG
jgi:hypothetical protein